MITLLLVFHVGLAIISLIFSGIVVFYAKKDSHKSTQRLKTMWQGTVATLSSGVLLAVLTHSPVGSTCMSLFGFLAVVTAATAYQKWVYASSRSSI